MNQYIKKINKSIIEFGAETSIKEDLIIGKEDYIGNFTIKVNLNTKAILFTIGSEVTELKTIKDFNNHLDYINSMRRTHYTQDAIANEYSSKLNKASNYVNKVLAVKNDKPIGFYEDVYEAFSHLYYSKDTHDYLIDKMCDVNIDDMRRAGANNLAEYILVKTKGIYITPYGIIQY